MLGNNDYSWGISDCGKLRHSKIWTDYYPELKKGDLVTLILN